MKTLKIILFAFILMASTSCKKGSDQTDINTILGSWYESIALKPKGEIVEEYTFHDNNRYTLKITFKGIIQGTNSNDVTAERLETGKYVDNEGTLRFYIESLTSWETGFPTYNQTYNEGTLSREVKYRFVNGNLELESRGPGPADEPIVYISTYTRRDN